MTNSQTLIEALSAPRSITWVRVYCAIAQWFEVCLCVVLCCRYEPLPVELPWYVAQFVERSPRLRSVVGSNPT